MLKSFHLFDMTACWVGPHQLSTAHPGLNLMVNFRHFELTLAATFGLFELGLAMTLRLFGLGLAGTL